MMKTTIASMRDGDHVRTVLLCKQKIIAITRNGKEYGNLVFQDKTGQVDAKIWDLLSPAIREFEAMDFCLVEGNVTIFNNNNQLNVTKISRAEDGQYDPADFFPASSRDIGEMTEQLKELAESVKDPALHALLRAFFWDPAVLKRFVLHSAAKSVHHGFIGGLLEHTLSVAKLCSLAADHYAFADRDLLVTGALLHDIGKLRELSPFPYNEYTDEGQLLGHIVIGLEMVSEKISALSGFPEKRKAELLHLIAAHHGELEYGSPKKPALMEALILSFVDNLDAKVETMNEALNGAMPAGPDGWMGFNRYLDSNIRRT